MTPIASERAVGRFTIVAAVHHALSALARRPLAIFVVVLANIGTIAILSIAERTWLGGAEPAMLLARSAGRLALALNNATLGLLILVIAVEGLKKRSDSWQGRWQRVGAAFIPALLLSILDQISWIALDVHATGWFLGKFANHFEWIVVADLLADILIACTIGFSAFAVVSAASNITLSQSLRRSMQLSGRARWKLSWMAVIFSTITLILFFVDSIITGRIFPDLYAQIIADQTLATTWRAFTVLVIAGAGTVLARDEDVPESWATQFD